MAKRKTSVTLDGQKVERARQLIATASVSELLDVALTRLIELELDRRHVEGYRHQPPEPDDLAWAATRRAGEDLDDDTDWAALYGLEP